MQCTTSDAVDGRVFGPYYPSTLQLVIDHAERLWALVAIHEVAPPAEEWAKAWLVGRSEEIARVASDTVLSFRGGRIPDAQAAAELDAYLVSVHQGLARHLGCDAPACCQAPESTSVAQTRDTVQAPVTAVTEVLTTH